MSKQFHTFMSHVSQDNLIRLMQQLLRINKLSPAESELADRLIQETNLNIEVK